MILEYLHYLSLRNHSPLESRCFGSLHRSWNGSIPFSRRAPSFGKMKNFMECSTSVIGSKARRDTRHLIQILIYAISVVK